MSINNALFTFSALSVSTTETSLTASSTTVQSQTTACVATLVIDVSAMAAGDEFEIALYEKPSGSGDSQQRTVIANLVGPQANPQWTSPDSYQLGNGWDFTMTKKAGTDRAFTGSVRAIT